MAGPTLRGRITLDTKQFKVGLAKVKTDSIALGKVLVAKFKSIGSAISKGIKLGLAAAGAAIVATGITFAAFAVKIANVGDALDKMAKRTGFTVDELSKLGHAADRAGTNLVQVEDTMKDMQKNLTDAGLGTQGMIDNFALLGLEVEHLQGLKPGEQFNEIAAAVANIENPAQRATLAMRIFGEGGRRLLPMIENLEEARKRAEELGIVFTAEEVESIVKMKDSFADMKDSIFGLFKSVIGFDKLRIVMDKATSSIIAFRESAQFQEITAKLQAFGTSVARITAGVINALAKMDRGFLVILKAGGRVAAGVAGIVLAVTIGIPVLQAVFGLLISSGIMAPLAAGFAGVAIFLASIEIGEMLQDAFDLASVILILENQITGMFKVTSHLFETGFNALREALKHPFKRGFLFEARDEMASGVARLLKEMQDVEDEIETDGGVGIAKAFENKMADIQERVKAAMAEMGQKLADGSGLTEAVAAFNKIVKDFEEGIKEFDDAAANAGDGGLGDDINNINAGLDAMKAKAGEVKFVMGGAGFFGQDKIDDLADPAGAAERRAQRDPNQLSDPQAERDDTFSDEFKAWRKRFDGNPDQKILGANSTSLSNDLERLGRERNSKLDKLIMVVAGVQPVVIDSFGEV